MKYFQNPHGVTVYWPGSESRTFSVSDATLQDPAERHLRQKMYGTCNLGFKGGVSDPHMGIPLRQCHIFDARLTRKLIMKYR